ncbi:MAG: hypothetical protein IK114_02525 [Fibrobacter sp.]|nr:hypothetical protein [Fibrobacter sp.]
MKKLMILAALGTAALFTACGDDSSSGASAGCDVSSTENSVTVSISEAGYTSATTYTLTETGYKMSYSGEGSEGMPETEIPAEGTTLDQLKQIADEACKLWESAETVPAE